MGWFEPVLVKPRHTTVQGSPVSISGWQTQTLKSLIKWHLIKELLLRASGSNNNSIFGDDLRLFLKKWARSYISSESASP